MLKWGWVKLAAAAALACGGAALAQQPAQQPASPPAAANVAAPAATAPVPAVVPAAGQPAPAASATPAASAQPTSPLLAEDGAPVYTGDRTVGQPRDRVIAIQPQVTRNGEFASWFHNAILFPVITAISVLVLFLLIWVVIRFRKAANPIPSKTSHNTVLEVAWTLLPVVALVMIAVPSIGLLQAQFRPAPANAVTLKAVGNQWYWTYSYPDFGDFEITANMLKERGEVEPGARFRTDADGPKLLAVDNRVVLPVGVPIRIITTASDVIHSWAVPAFWFKLDAVPGRLNESSFTIERPGLYFGQCSELCGARHGYMPIAVQAVDMATFRRWIVAKGGRLPGAAEAAAPSSAVIPQPGAPGAAPATTPAAAPTAPAGPNPPTTAAPAPATQGATNNPAGAGNPGH